jgi:hypothetical protein
MVFYTKTIQDKVMYRKKVWLLPVLLAALLVWVNTPLCQANSAQPPAILIIVENPPSDLDLKIGDKVAGKELKANEGYYSFYFLTSPGNSLIVTTKGESFKVLFDTPPKNYDNVYTLDLKARTLTPGKSFSRTFKLVSIRIILTLAIEGLLFYLFGYRSRRSWIVFFAANLVTQAVLNIWLNNSFTPVNGYVIFSLIGAELLVLVIEVAAFLALINEHGRGRTGGFVVLANVLSLIAGGYLIMTLPV